MQTESQQQTYRHKHSLRCGDLVQFLSGDHAGICGEVHWHSHVNGSLIVRTQNGEYLPGQRNEVEKIM